MTLDMSSYRCRETIDLEDVPGADTGQRREEVMDAAMRAHVEMIHALAAPLADKGRLIVASYGENPATGKALSPKVEHYRIGDVVGMLRGIRILARDHHRNVYVPLAVMRADLPASGKGTEADVLGVLGLVADFDDEDAANYAHRLPVTAPYVLETSEGRFQAFLPLDRPATVAEAKAIAVRLKEVARCDHGTVDMSHVWRVPGTRNWPNKRKVDRGRSATPRPVRVVEPWDGAVIGLDEIRKALPEREERTTERPLFVERPADRHDLPPGLVERMNTAPAKGQRSENAFFVICALAERGWSSEEIVAEIQRYPHGVGERYAGREKELRAEVERGQQKAKGDRREAPGARPGARWEAFGNGKANGARHDQAKAEARADPEVGDDAGDILAEFTDPTKLTGIEPPAREWIVEGWLPVGTVTSLYGTGGVGKTLLAQLLQTAVGTGRPFLGVETTQCKVLSIFCEDDEDELHRRQVCINAGLGIGMQDLGAVRWQSRFGKTNVMATIEGGLLKSTDLYRSVLAAAKQSGARLVIVDNIAQVFAGNENVRAEVTQFVNSLGTIAQEIDGAVLLLGHPGKADNSEYSGSTAWDACVRSRWILERPKEDLDEEEAGDLADLRVLRRVKANYARKDDEIAVRWDAGTFRAEGPAQWKDAVDRIEERLQEKADDAAFLACLDALSDQGRNVSHSKFAPNYAPKLMSGKPETKGISKRRLERTMERLFTDREIVVGVCGRGADRKPINGIMRTGKSAVRETCGEPAGDLRETSGEVRETCGEPRDENMQEPAKSLKSERGTSCGEPAGNLRGTSEAETAKSLKSERGTCGEPAGGTYPLYTTYIEGGAYGAAPPSDLDTEAGELHRIIGAAGRLTDLSERLERFKPDNWLDRFEPVVPELSGLELLRKVEA